VLIAQEVTREHVLGKNAVVIDVLRATSTIGTALKNGCTAVFPVVSPEEAFEKAGTFDKGSCILGGERGGIKVPGFDTGNSPLEYSSDAVTGRSLVMTTTNGTLAINNSSAAKHLFLASLLNASAVAKALLKLPEDVMLVCSGTEGIFTIEDAYCAGMIAHILKTEGKAQLTDMAEACRIIYEMYLGRPLDLLYLATHGQKLNRIGFADDVVYCSQTDLLDVVPVYENGRITKL
jgi:2-phosphosulfolactate phosphatase